MSSTINAISLLVSIILTAKGREDLASFVKAFVSYLKDGDTASRKTVEGYKYLPTFGGYIDVAIRLSKLIIGFGGVARVNSIDPRKTLKITYKGKEHLVGVVKATDVGLPERIVGEAICRPAENFSFVIMSDALYENDFVLMHEVGHSVQRMILNDKFGKSARTIMDVLNSIGQVFGGFPLEPQADAFAAKYSGYSRIEYAKVLAMLTRLATQDLSTVQTGFVASLMAGRFLGGLVAPVLEAKIEETDNVLLLLPLRDTVANERLIEMAEAVEKVLPRLEVLSQFLANR